jgi:antitoxin component YwqK of YwqJK toxin-antitoxin module
MNRIIGIIVLSFILLTSAWSQSRDSIGKYDDVIMKLNENKVDSFGQKQGMWTERKVLYSEVMFNETIPAEKDGEIVLIIYDKKTYNENSPIIICSGEYINNLKTGLWTEKFPNDTIKSLIEYKNGIPNGLFRIYYGNGQLKAECEIGNEFKIPVVGYDEEGNMIMESVTEKNEIIKFIYEE